MYTIPFDSLDAISKSRSGKESLACSVSMFDLLCLNHKLTLDYISENIRIRIVLLVSPIAYESIQVQEEVKNSEFRTCLFIPSMKIPWTLGINLANQNFIARILFQTLGRVACAEDGCTE